MVEINTSAQPQLVDIYTFLKNEFEGTLPFLDSLAWYSKAAAARRVRKWEAAAEGEEGLVLGESISSRAERKFGSSPSPIFGLSAPPLLCYAKLSENGRAPLNSFLRKV